MEHDWTLAEGHTTEAPALALYKYATGQKLTVRGELAISTWRAIGGLLDMLRPRTSLDQQLFRDVEYRAMREIVLARAFKLAETWAQERGED
jgi:hypothetical protein